MNWIVTLTSAVFLLSLIGGLTWLILHDRKQSSPTTEDTRTDTFDQPTDEDFVLKDRAHTTFYGPPNQYPVPEMKNISPDALAMFDHVYYINLDGRTDRRDHVLSQLRLMNVPGDKITRIPGVKAKFGALGCSKAHLNALQAFRESPYNSCVVLEDDFVWKGDYAQVHKTLNRFTSLGIDWDVLMLSNNLLGYGRTYTDFLLKTLDAQTTAGYAVNRTFLPKLMRNFARSIEKLEACDQAEHDFCIDLYWKKLQPRNKWFSLYPTLAHQRDDYSDIEQRQTSYTDKQDVKSPHRCYEYLIMVKTCYAHWNAKEFQQKRQQWQKFCETSASQVIFYASNPHQHQPYVFDIIHRLLSLKTEDDYMNLSHKFGEMLKFLHIYLPLNWNLSHLKGVVFADDDIDVTRPDILLSTMNQNCKTDYWGNVTHQKGKTSDHFKTKAEQSMNVQRRMQQYYEPLLNNRIIVPQSTYCSGGLFYLRADVVFKLNTEENHFLFDAFPRELGPFMRRTKRGELVVDVPQAFDDMNVGIALNAQHIHPTEVDVFKFVKW